MRQDLLAKLGLWAVIFLGLSTPQCRSTGSRSAAADSGDGEAKAYAIFDETILDAPAYARYLGAAGPLVLAYGGQALAVGTKHDLLEGDVKPGTIVILEFPSLAKLNTWYRSPAYQPLLQDRLQATKGTFTVAKNGVPGPATPTHGKPKAYALFNEQVTDTTAYQSYLEKAAVTVKRYGGRALAVGSQHDLLEGGSQPQTLVLLEFPDMESLRRWYTADDYQPLIKERVAASTVVFAIAKEGLSPQ